MLSSISSSFGYGNQMGVQSIEHLKEKMFSRVDSDGSGGIDKTEFSDLSKKMAEMSGTSQSVEDMFAQYDANGDNSLSTDELDSFMKDNPPPPPPMGHGGPVGGLEMGNGLNQLFGKIDTDTDGSINQSEFDVFAKTFTERTHDSINVENGFSVYDVNGDNSLSMDELDSFMKDHPPVPPVAMQDAMSTYGTTMGQDQLSSLRNLLSNQLSDSSSGNSDITSAIGDIVSKLLDIFGSRVSSGETSILINVQA